MCFFGSVRLIIMFRVYGLICSRYRSSPWTHLPKNLFNMFFRRQAGFCIIHYFHSHHNTPCLPPPPPTPQILRNHCFQFLLGVTKVPREIKDNPTFGGRGGGGGRGKTRCFMVSVKLMNTHICSTFCSNPTWLRNTCII